MADETKAALKKTLASLARSFNLPTPEEVDAILELLGPPTSRLQLREAMKKIESVASHLPK